MFGEPVEHDLIITPSASAPSDYVSRYLQGLRFSRSDSVSLAASAVQSYLDTPSPETLARIDAAMPRLPGEVIQTSRVRRLSEPWHSFPAGTVLYQRETDQGSLTAALRPSAGALTASPTALPNLLTSSNWMSQVMDGAFTLATFAGYALGPEGLVLAAGATILQELFHTLSDNRQQVPESEIVARLLHDELAETEIQTALASFETTYQWFQEYYLQEWSDDDQTSTEEELTEFKNNLAGALGPNSLFLIFLNLLQQSRYATMGFTAFVLGASLHVVLLKIDLILKSTDQRVVDTPAIQPLIDYLGRYAEHATSTMATIDAIIDNRLKLIGDVTQENGNYVFVDKGDTTQNPNGVKYTYNNKGDASTGHDLVALRVKAQQNLQYYASRPDKAVATRDEWQTAQKKYHALKNPDSAPA